MKKLKQCLACLLAAACLFAGMVRAEGAQDYSGTITMITPFEPADNEDDLAGGPAACFEALIARWQEEHPQIRLEVKTRTFSDISALALMDHLPDVFALAGADGRLFAHYGFIADPTGAVLDGQDAQRYDTAALVPYIYYGRAAAFPVLAKSHAMVLWDTRVWAAAGLDGFPQTLEAAMAQAAAFRDRGFKGMIALGNADGMSAIRGVTGPLLYRDGGVETFMHMVEEDETCTLRDAAFIDALTGTEALLNGIFAVDRPGIDADRALRRFVKGDCPALLVGGDDAYSALDAIREDAPELYAALDFAALPVALGDDAENFVPTGIALGLFINARTAGEPGRFAACVDLCRALTGPAYADMLAERFGRQCFTRADDAAWQAFYQLCGDDTLVRLVRFINDRVNPCLDITQFLHGTVWQSGGQSLIKRLKADLNGGARGYVPTWDEAANAMQDCYERYCLVRPTPEEAMAEASGQDGAE